MLQRKSNIELLRIFSMLLIVTSHLFVHTDWIDVSIVNEYIINIFRLGEVGVCCFVLICGFFSYEKTIKISSLLRIILQTSFYSLTCFLLFKLLKIGGNYDRFSLTPILSGAYWFVSTYVGLYLTIPLLNLLIGSLSKFGHLSLLVSSFIVLSVIPTFLHESFIFSNYTYFCFLYCVGSYFGKYGNPLRGQRSLFRNMILLGSWVLLFTAVIVTTRSVQLNNWGFTPWAMISLNSSWVFMASVATFLFFDAIGIPYLVPINTFASAAFGVYLLTDNYLVRPILWGIVNAASAGEAYFVWFLLYCFIAILLIYIVASMVDLLRLYCLERPLFKLLNNLLPKLDSFFSRMLSKAMNS